MWSEGTHVLRGAFTCPFHGQLNRVYDLHHDEGPFQMLALVVNLQIHGALCLFDRSRFVRSLKMIDFGLVPRFRRALGRFDSPIWWDCWTSIFWATEDCPLHPPKAKLFAEGSIATKGLSHCDGKEP